MGLYKQMRDGITGAPVSYHRIVRLEIETNVRVGVYIHSYISLEERELEKENDGAEEPILVFHSDSYFATSTPEGPATVAEAYTWLKENRPEFEGAEDVFDES